MFNVERLIEGHCLCTGPLSFSVAAGGPPVAGFADVGAEA